MFRSQKTNRSLMTLSIAIRYLAGGSQRGVRLYLCRPIVRAPRESRCPRKHETTAQDAVSRGAARRGEPLTRRRAVVECDAGSEPRGARQSDGKAVRRAPRRLSARFSRRCSFYWVLLVEKVEAALFCGGTVAATTGAVYAVAIGLYHVFQSCFSPSLLRYSLHFSLGRTLGIHYGLCHHQTPVFGRP